MASSDTDSFKSRTSIKVGDRDVDLFRLDALAKEKVGDIETLPFSLKVLLENLVRHEDGKTVTRDDIEKIASWDPQAKPSVEIAYRPSRVLLQDFTGVPAVVDLAAMREAFQKMGGDPAKIRPLQPADLVIDHSVQVDHYGTPDALEKNIDMEFIRNRERYLFLKWGQQAFKGFTVVPPGTGIVHQVNLEYLARVVFTDEGGVAYPDSLVGTDSHTTMINGLGVLGWGVGGIEAEAAMLGQPISMLVPQVVGFKLKGSLKEGATATDLVLTVTQMLRSHGVVGKFVEFFGDGLDSMSLPNRATIANMSPEYGATMGFFPVDDEILSYLRFTGRDEKQVQLVERYTKEQGLFRTKESPEPRFSATVELELGDVVPCISGPKRPQDRIPLTDAKRAWRRTLVGMTNPKVKKERLETWVGEGGQPAGEQAAIDGLHDTAPVKSEHGDFDLPHGAVVIAAITSCTNTSNPAVLLAAGLLARNAVERGLMTKPWVKTSLAPGSQVVTDYLKEAGLLEDLEELDFDIVGYGCTTCIGNSGPVDEPIAKAVAEHNLVVTSVLSGNRNFEGRINPVVRANYLASPPLVVAYALAGTLDFDFEKQPLGQDEDGEDVYLKDIWPEEKEITELIRTSVKTEMFKDRYGHVQEGPGAWKALKAPTGAMYNWREDSTYIRNPPFFDGMTAEEPSPPEDIKGARVLALLGDSVTTDHISPAGSIAASSPAGKYLQEHGVKPAEFNSYGARRGNHEVMMRGTFANIRLRNLLAPGTEGGVTRYLPDGDEMSIFDASMKYQKEGVPLIVLAGKEYGSGSSRDWAAKGTMLLGVKAVIAASYERIHRSNLIGMGVLPLQFKDGEDRDSLGLDGTEVYELTGIAGGLRPGQEITVKAGDKEFTVKSRIDTPQEVEYVTHGGILQYVLRQMRAV